MDEKVMKFINGLIPKCYPIDGWCSIEKMQRLALVVMELQAQLVVEVGVYGGKSLIPMALACEFNGKGKVHGIDPWKVDAALEGTNIKGNDDWWQSMDFDWIKNRFIGTVKNMKLEKYCEWHQMKSCDGVKLFENGSIDVFHQDSNHSEEVSCAEVEMWMPKMAEECAWICDDTDWPTIQKSLELIESNGFILVGDYRTWRIYRRSK